MTRYAPALLLALAVFAALLALAAAATAAGFVTDDTITLWAGAISAGDGQVSIGRIVASYPTLPFLATTLIELVAPAGTPTPALLSAALGGLTAAIWLVGLRSVGLSPLVALGAVLLLISHPASLHAALTGPAEMFLILFLMLFAVSLYDLRATTAAPQVMMAGLSLVGVAFSHPLGAAIAFAALPFLVFAVSPSLVANSAPSIVLVLLFPVVFGFFAFTYISWVFPGSGWSFFAAPAESLAAWGAALARLFGADLVGVLPLQAGVVMVLALLLGAPLLPVAVFWSIRRRPLVAPALVLAAILVSAAVVAACSDLFGNPAPLMVAAPILALAAIRCMPPVRQRPAAMMLLLAVGWIGGAFGLAIADPRLPAQLRAALDGAGGDRERIDTLALGGMTVGRAGVLADTDNAPALVVGRGRARGLMGPANEEFAFSTLFRRINAPFVAVPDPQSAAGVQDRLNKTFPRLFRYGAPEYRLIYQNPTWRLFARRHVGDR